MENLYQNKTEFYDKGRLGYSAEALDLVMKLVDDSQAVIADMGSGTGIFSTSLLEKGYTVFCVEPDIALQQKANERLSRYPNYKPIIRPAEATDIPPKSVDAITAASAFHWFDPSKFLKECRRILKPNGRVFLLYNVRKTDDSFSQEHELLCRRYCPSFISLHHGFDKASDRCSLFFANGYKKEQYPNDLVYTADRFLARCLSSSYSLSSTHPEYIAYQQALKQLIDDHAINDQITVRNYTVVWYGAI